ncbi:MAG: hypothetical protein B7Y50_01295 [Hydrogenophilales bacterium 28-61-11]|nr:MAG: hypothetical protein B7Y50_01295 [Hydrogenophilales bacterium 28-61-11]
MSPIVEVVAAVLTRPDGEVMLASRPPGKVYAGYWEFPGGKVEAGETLQAALARELTEELGIAVLRAERWVTRVFTYEHATVRLNFFRIVEWQGEPHPHEGQTFSWQAPSQVTVSPLLPANFPILKALTLPPLLGITHAEPIGVAAFLARLEMALDQGLKLILVRDKTQPEPERLTLARERRPITPRRTPFCSACPATMPPNSRTPPPSVPTLPCYPRCCRHSPTRARRPSAGNASPNSPPPARFRSTAWEGWSAPMWRSPGRTARMVSRCCGARGHEALAASPFASGRAGGDCGCGLLV